MMDEPINVRLIRLNDAERSLEVLARQGKPVRRIVRRGHDYEQGRIRLLEHLFESAGIGDSTSLVIHVRQYGGSQPAVRLRLARQSRPAVHREIATQLLPQVSRVLAV